ncbi:MAG: chemotaxis protein CheD [Planctomycetales bacterium]
MNSRTKPLSLPMGEIAVARNEGVLRTLLGSCLGLALYDRRLKVGGLAHIVLPHSQGRVEIPGKFADTALPALLARMQQLVNGERLKPCAKIAGGANMFATSDATNTIGVQNVDAVERLLDGMRIPIIARHCGGAQGRRMTLDTTTGAVTIDVVGAETMTI